VRKEEDLPQWCQRHQSFWKHKQLALIVIACSLPSVFYKRKEKVSAINDHNPYTLAVLRVFIS
jgi:hypothetical protein